MILEKLRNVAACAQTHWRPACLSLVIITKGIFPFGCFRLKYEDFADEQYL